MNSLTKITPQFLHGNVIVFSGEDEVDIVTVIKKAGFHRSLKIHKYRSYVFMKYDKFSIVISPFGTSSIEPLLFEIFSTYQVEKIVLAGLCKRFHKSEAETGTVYVVNKAYSASTGLDDEVKFPVTYKFEIRGKLPFMNAVSTDFYYGFNEEPNTVRNKLLLLQKKYKSFSKKVELVDFDTAQFYAVCRMFAENKIFEYVALKAVSQSINAFQDQIKNPIFLLDLLFSKSLEQIDVKKST